jgi:CheY-like chemotaxis protein
VAHPTTPPGVAPEPQSLRRRVLLVEEIDSIRERVAGTLRSRGFDVTEASDGLKALKAVSTEQFHVIVLDLIRTDADGWQFRETQLRHPELAAIPTVIIADGPLPETERYALRTPGIVASFDGDDLVAAVNRTCAAAPRASNGDGAGAAGDGQLFWSRRGEIACALHAPDAQSARWRDEQWMPIAPAAAYQQIVYQCQHCPGNQGPIQRRPHVDKWKSGKVDK